MLCRRVVGSLCSKENGLVMKGVSNLIEEKETLPVSRAVVEYKYNLGLFVSGFVRVRTNSGERGAVNNVNLDDDAKKRKGFGLCRA